MQYTYLARVAYKVAGLQQSHTLRQSNCVLAALEASTLNLVAGVAARGLDDFHEVRAADWTGPQVVWLTH